MIDRDAFAAAALSGILACPSSDEMAKSEIVSLALDYADEMMIQSEARRRARANDENVPRPRPPPTSVPGPGVPRNWP